MSGSGKSYGKNDSQINARIGETFSIELESNPTTGYEWHADFDSNKVKLKEKTFEPAKSNENIGAAGREVLVFETIAEGSSIIRFDYKRSWETSGDESLEFKIEAEKD